MKYEKIDLTTWKRGELFEFYIKNLRNVMSLTAEIDVEPLLRFIKKEGLKFYPSMIWAVSKVVNAHEEFRFGWHENDLILWDKVYPYYADFHVEDETCVKLVTPCDDDLYTFHAAFMIDRTRYKSLRAFDLKEVPQNTFDVSCLPWLKYQHFDIHVFDEGKYLAPVITWGKYEVCDNKAMMPLTMNIHHAVCDGFHLCRFFKEVQELIYHL